MGSTGYIFSTAAGLTGLNAGKVMQVDFDNNGNIYVQGGDNENAQIAKYDPTGNLLWQFTSTVPTIYWRYGDNFGGWAVERTTGNVYLGQGEGSPACTIIRLNSNTGAYDNFRSTFFTDGDGNRGENWKMRWYCNSGSPQLLIAGGSGGIGSFHDNIGVMPLPFTGFTTYNVTGITTYPYNQDVSDFVVDPANNDLYCILASGNTPFVSNRIYKNSFPYTAANQKWNTLSGYPVLREDHNAPFMKIGTDLNNPGLSTNATNILVVTAKYLFYYDGKNLKAFDKATGAAVGTPVTFPSWTALMQQGIFADNCDHVYIGAPDGTIKVFLFNGVLFDDNAAPDISIPGFSGKAVYALTYDQNHNLLCVGGDGFAGTIDLSSYCVPPPPSLPTYNLIVNPGAPNVSALVSPAPSAGIVVTYTLQNGTTTIGSNTSGSFTGLDPAVTYTMNADFVDGCNSVHLTTQFKLKILAMELKATDICGASAGMITALASGGSSPYIYNINGGSFQTDNVFKGLSTGTYTVMVKDAAGSTVSLSASITANDLTVDAGNDAVICEGTFTQLSGSTNGTGLSWSPSAGLNEITIANPKASPQTTTKYYFSATKGDCTLSDSLIVTVLPAPVANAGKDTGICYASDAVLHGSGGTNYSWTPVTYLNNPAIAEPMVVHALQSVAYILRVTDASGCSSLHGDTVLLKVVPPVQVSVGSDTIIAMNQPLQLQAIDKNQSGFDQYTWIPSYGLNNPSAQNPIAVVDNNITYQVTAVTPEGCTATDAINVKVYKYSDIYVPNAFTPNGDGRNDIFRITAPGLKKLTYFIVVNRWGQEVFRTSNPSAGWDGTLNGVRQDAGVFVWVVEGVDYTGRIIRNKGTVVLIR